jgi:cation transport ATPase
MKKLFYYILLAFLTGVIIFLTTYIPTNYIALVILGTIISLGVYLEHRVTQVGDLLVRIQKLQIKTAEKLNDNQKKIHDVVKRLD